MTKLINELQRLYFLQDQPWQSQAPADSGGPTGPALGPLTAELVATSLAGDAMLDLCLINSDGMVRTMVIGFARASDWDYVARLYEGIQTQLELPAPAVSIVAGGGYQLWFSLAEETPAAQARAFLHALRAHYLADIPATQITLHPAASASATELQWVTLVPALHAAIGRWSAFIDPSLGSMFVDEPGLEMAPNMEGQADILVKFKSIPAADFQRLALSFQIHAEPDTAPAADSLSDRPAGATHSTLSVGNNYSDPQSFLLAVMNDPSASADQRIKAAEALLPYFARMEKT